MEYRKKPVVIQASIWDGTLSGMIALQQELGAEYAAFQYLAPLGHTDKQVLQIATLEGVMEAKPGDYIIKGIKGEFYPCKPDIFAATYEAAAIQPKEVPDYEAVARVIEHAHYICDAWRHYMKVWNERGEYLEKHGEDGDEAQGHNEVVSDAWGGISSRVHEFEKRASRLAFPQQ